MTRLAILRAGYATLGLAFAALASSLVVGGLLLPSLALALLGGLLLAFSDDDLPKWSGLALVAYFVLSALAFFATTSVTIRSGGSNFYFAPPALSDEIVYWTALASPIMLAAAAIGAAWERERAPRLLLFGALGGLLLFALLSLVLVPKGLTTSGAADAARAQGDMLRVLFGVSAAAGAAGALWAAGRPDSL